MMDEDYTHWICINRATTISNDSTKQNKNAKIYWCTFPIIMHQYIHVHVYIWVVYIQWITFFLPIYGGSEVYIPYKLFSKVCNVYLVVLKKNWGKKFIYQQILI